MKQSIVRIDVVTQYRSEDTPKEQSLCVDEAVRNLEVKTGDTALLVTLRYKDGTMTTYEYKNEIMKKLTVYYGAGLVDWSSAEFPIKDKTQ